MADERLRKNILDTEGMSLSDLQKVARTPSTLSLNICEQALGPSLGEEQSKQIFERHEQRAAVALKAISENVSSQS